MARARLPAESACVNAAMVVVTEYVQANASAPSILWSSCQGEGRTGKLEESAATAASRRLCR